MLLRFSASFLLPLPHAPLTVYPFSGNIMIEYCYPECTTSVITSLAIFRKHYPQYRTADIEFVLFCILPIFRC